MSTFVVIAHYLVILIPIFKLENVECHLNFVSMYYGNAPSIGAETMATAYEVTLEVLSMKYPLVFANYTYTSANASDIGNTCSVAAKESSVNFMANFYQQGVLERGQTILMAPVCSISFAPIGDFAKELDLLAVACASPDSSFYDKQRYPSLLSFGSADISGCTKALLKLMRSLKWRSIAVVSDTLSQNPYAVKASETCRPALEYFRANGREFDFLEVKTDSIMEGFTRALLAASNFSRIILSCTLSLPQRQFLATASDLGMTSGDYVFIYFYGVDVPFEHALQWSYNDTLSNEKILDALASVVVIRFPQYPWENITEFSKRVLQRRLKYYNTPINQENQYNEYLIGCYEAIESLAQVLNESGSKNPAHFNDLVISGKELAQHFFNRTFHLETRSVSVSPGGARITELEIQMFKNDKKMFQKVLGYDDTTQQLIPTENNLTWKLGTPPRDRPLCGVRNDRCLTSSFQKLAVGISIGAIVFTTLVIFGAIQFIRWRQTEAIIFSEWWKINQEEVVHGQRSHHRYAIITQKAASKPAVVSFLCSSASALTKKETRKNFMRFLHQLRSIAHPNICGFIGLCMDTKAITAYEEFSGRGSLEQLIAGDHLEWNLKLSLLRDLAQAVKYIHHSTIKLHGNFKCSSCFIDNYLGLKVADVGHEQTSTFLSGELLELRLHTNKHIWMAPEVLRCGVSTQYSEIYSVSIVAHQILEECGPYNLEQNSADLSLVSVALETIEKGNAAVYRPTFAQQYTGNCTQLHQLMTSCWDEDPFLRPAAAMLRDRILTIARDEGLPGSLFDAIVKRLEIYSATLENTVGNRTEQLKFEQRRCDDILADVLPRGIVRILRQGGSVIPEMFNSATLFFSDIPEFAAFATVSAPVAVMTFLHQIYSLFDIVIAQYQVYKVETIADSYVVASGLPTRNKDKHVGEICSMALRLQLVVQQWWNQAEHFQLRVGIHTGPVATAVIGKKQPRYCLFGDTVNTASRMESYGEGSKIHVSSSTRELGALAGFAFTERGIMTIKGKGDIMTYWLTASSDDADINSHSEQLY